MEINDVYLHQIVWKGNDLTLVRESDPVLRRFGQCDLVRSDQHQPLEVFRKRADELWIVLNGDPTEFVLNDLRPDSPSFQNEQKIMIEAVESGTLFTKEALLIPFGVAFRIECQSPTSFIRLTTHQNEDDPEDKTP